MYPRPVQVQVQKSYHCCNAILKNSVKVFCLDDGQFSLAGFQPLAVLKELKGTVCGLLVGSIVRGIPSVIAVKLPCFSSLEVFEVTLAATKI